LKTVNTTVLVCPLDWGLGHASRVIPLILHFRTAGYKVIIGGSGKSGELLKSTFGELLFIHLPSREIRYPLTGPWLFLSLLIQFPALVYFSIREHYQLKKAVRRYGIDLVVSDNRYGLFCRNTHNIIITHQISPVMPRFLKLAEYPIYLILKTAVQFFDECWIPDYPGDINLSGSLSHRYPLPRNARYIGLLSRFTEINSGNWNEGQYDLVMVLSGPQPELSKLTQKMTGQASRTALKTLIICGFEEIPDSRQTKNANLNLVSHLEPEQFRNVLEKAPTLICTAGYSGIMDLVMLGRTAILMPTPGQSEQEYLTGYLDKSKTFVKVTQSELDLENLPEYIRDLSLCKPFKPDRPVKITDIPYFRMNTATITKKPSRNPA
jgi:UDP:flavonoid glycosyltransferase YjiC (YdhE family)